MSEKSEHILSRFDDDLEGLRGFTLAMGNDVLDQTHRAVHSLVDCDAGAANKVLYREKRINAYDMEAQEKAVKLLAVHGPVARDLRLVICLTRVVSDLERVGDAAKQIARVTIRNFEHSQAMPDCDMFRDVGDLSVRAERQLAQALEAIRHRNVEIALKALRGDEGVDELFSGAVRRLSTYLLEDPRNIRWVIDALFAIKAVERVGDHAAAIAANLIYALKGKDVRYMLPENLSEEFLDSELL
jgi:phosphate transport system protein